MNTETVKDQEPEIETDIFWDSLTEIEDVNEIVMSKKSETETYVSWANPLQQEEEHEKDENANRDTSETCIDGKEYEFDTETSRELKDKTVKDVSNISKDIKIKKSHRERNSYRNLSYSLYLSSRLRLPRKLEIW